MSDNPFRRDPYPNRHPLGTLRRGGMPDRYRPGIDIPPNSVMDGWMQSYTGRQMWPLALTPDQVHLEDIAHALALKVRFNGHCKWHYSIAQHSVLVSMLVPTADAIEGLMHDAAEAYLADIPRPVKPMIKEWKALEHRVEAAIAKRFGYRFPYPDSVKIADNAMVLTERKAIMATPQPHMKWDVPGEAAKIEILEWNWREAEEIFLIHADQLGVR